MLGGEILCLREKQMFFLAEKAEPWNGLLVCTSREHHASLMKEHPGLTPHAVLGKWLYLPRSAPRHAETAARLAGAALQGDPRIGVRSKKRARRPARAAASC
jgi:hypothetical protein